jgi:predicted GIY-YIG superfamily endonuclease
VSPPTGGPIIPPPKVPTVDPPAIDNTDKEFDEKIQDLEKKVASIKNSETAKKVKDSWDNLWVDVKDSAADAQTQLKILLLKQKIDAAARKVTPAGQTMNFVDCTGWNTLGCKSDSIKKVQNCMDIGVSGNFDEFLKSELARYKSTYAFREGFSDSDVQKICAYKQEENRQEALKREQLAKQAQKAAEIQAFERKYPQVFTPATERDEF